MQNESLFYLATPVGAKIKTLVFSGEVHDTELIWKLLEESFLLLKDLKVSG